MASRKKGTRGEPGPRPRGTGAKRPIEQYDHPKAKRANNPPAVAGVYEAICSFVDDVCKINQRGTANGIFILYRSESARPDARHADYKDEVRLPIYPQRGPFIVKRDLHWPAQVDDRRSCWRCI